VVTCYCYFCVVDGVAVLGGGGVSCEALDRTLREDVRVHCGIANWWRGSLVLAVLSLVALANCHYSRSDLFCFPDTKMFHVNVTAYISCCCIAWTFNRVTISMHLHISYLKLLGRFLWYLALAVYIKSYANYILVRYNNFTWSSKQSNIVNVTAFCDVTPCSAVSHFNVSEESAASIFRVQDWGPSPIAPSFCVHTTSLCSHPPLMLLAWRQRQQASPEILQSV
jgi:hypothetical protein